MLHQNWPSRLPWKQKERYQHFHIAVNFSCFICLFFLDWTRYPATKLLLSHDWKGNLYMALFKARCLTLRKSTLSEINPMAQAGRHTGIPLHPPHQKMLTFDLIGCSSSCIYLFPFLLLCPPEIPLIKPYHSWQTLFWRSCSSWWCSSYIPVLLALLF